jgi:hypothetical protein
MSSVTKFVSQVQPHHGQVMRNVFSEEIRQKLRTKLDAMPSSDTWYGDIYKKAIYGPMVFRDKELNIENTVKELLPGYRILADLYLEKTPQDDGFPFHTDFDSNGFMERPEEMVTLWVPLTPVKEVGSGQLSVVNQEGAIRLSLIRVANQLHSLVAMMDETIPRHQSFSVSSQERTYLENSKFTPALDAGDALVFCNAFFHKSEPVVSGTPGLHEDKRASYILRCVPENAKFNKTRLLALKSLGQNLTVVEELLAKHYPDAEEPEKSDQDRSAF